VGAVNAYAHSHLIEYSLIRGWFCSGCVLRVSAGKEIFEIEIFFTTVFV
jgi:hypothetical protein